MFFKIGILKNFANFTGKHPWQRTLRAYVPTCLACFLCYVPTCSHAITTNNKNKFSIICFLYISVLVLSLFPCEIKVLYILALLLPSIAF